MTVSIQRLSKSHAAAIVECFRRVYGDSYANEVFYDEVALGRAMSEQRLCCVGAISSTQKILGHMAMTLHPQAICAELGNTVVDPEARGEGLAWKVGAQLSAWCTELGFEAYLHYPTTDHHIMQRQSVKSGFETGLMLGYIPVETDGKVSSNSRPLRGAATIVFQPLTEQTRSESAYLPTAFGEDIISLASDCGLSREWKDPPSSLGKSPTHWEVNNYAARSLTRLEVRRVGRDIVSVVDGQRLQAQECRQLDFQLSDPCIDHGVDAALEAGFVFCGWLPGYRDADVLRLQWIDRSVIDVEPAVVNPTAQQILKNIQDALA